MKAALLALVLAAVAIAVWLARAPDPLGDGGSASGAPSARGKASRSLSPDAVLSMAPGARPSKAAAAIEKPRMSPVLQEFIFAKSLRPLFDRLRTSTNRTAEETYILASITENCGKITDRKRTGPQRNNEEERKRFLASISDKDPDAAKRIDSYDRASKSRCEGFEGVEATNADIRALLEQASSDPKARARLIEKDVYATLPNPEGPYFFDGKSKLPAVTDEQIASLQRAAQSGDPVAVATVGRILASTMNDLAIRAGPADRAVDPRVWSDAWRLAACDMGANCGTESAVVLYACAMQGNCGAQDLREHLFFFEHSPQQSQRLQEYETQLLQAVRTGDWSYFNFHRGPSNRNWMTIQIQP